MTGSVLYNSLSEQPDTEPLLLNCILWGNEMKGGVINDEGDFRTTVSACIVEGGYDNGIQIMDADPRLHPIHDNGGNTMTFALGPNSPAVDAGVPDDAPETDQRGVIRPQGQGVDLGAYEYDGSTQSWLDVLSSGLDFGRVTIGVESYSLSYRVAAAGLDGNVLVSPPDACQLSVDGSTWLDPEEVLTLVPTYGVIDRVVHVRFVPTELRDYSGRITHSSGGLSMSLDVTGTGDVARVLYASPDGDNSTGGSWNTAFHDPQQAIDVAAAFECYGTEVWVASGTYTPTYQWDTDDSRAFSFQLRNRVAVYGGFAGDEVSREQRDTVANQTVFSGDIGTENVSSDNAYHVFFHPEGTDLDATAVLDGCTLLSGNADTGSPSNAGGAMCNRGSSPRLVNCTFRKCLAIGAGAAVSNYRSSPSIIRCTFADNSTARTGFGGAIENDLSSSTIDRCVCYDNAARFCGGAIYDHYSATGISNCVFLNNEAGSPGGAIYSSKSRPDIVNCTFYNNSAPSGGAIANTDSSPYVANCIFYGNGDDVANGDLTLFHNNLFDATDISGFSASNLSGDPLFSDPQFPAGSDGLFGTADDGLRPLRRSPCIDAGDSSLLLTGTNQDMAGGARIQGDALDIGAYEHQAFPRDDMVITYRIEGSDEALLSSATESAHWLECSVPMGSFSPAVTVTDVPTGMYLAWIGPGGVIRHDNPLVIEAVDQDQMWTAFIAPAIAGLDGIAHVRENAVGSGLSWADATGDLQAAIDAASLFPQGAVWVASGTYLPRSSPSGGTGERDVHFSLRNHVSVYGGFPSAGDPSFGEREPPFHPTILSADIGVEGDDSDNAYHVFYHPEELALDNSAILDGVTITAGRALSRTSPWGSGGGMYNSHSSPHIIRCIFAANEARGGGGLYNDSSDPLFTNCVFSQNASLYYGGAVTSTGYSSATFANCTFAGNVSGSGHGGAIYTGASSVATAANCIFWENGDEVDSGDKALFSHNVIPVQDISEYPSSNTDRDPLLADVAFPAGLDGIYGTADDGLLLMPGSSCIDAGNGDIFPADILTDLAWNPRIEGEGVDLGAFEQTAASKGTVQVGFRMQGSSEARLVNGPATARWFTIAMPKNSSAPLISVSAIPAGMHLVWIGPDGEILHDNPLSLSEVTEDQTWTAVVASTVPNRDGVIHVREGGTGSGASWADAAGDFQGAIESAALMSQREVQLWVAAGVYRPSSWPNGNTTERAKHFSLRNGVSVYGGFPASGTPPFPSRDPSSYLTLLSGDIGAQGDPSDNCLHVFYHPEAAELGGTAVLDGVVITGGNADISSSGGLGGGMYNDSCSPTVSRCRFEDNHADDGGGAIYNSNCSPVIAGCTFALNSAENRGGAMRNTQSSPTVIDSVFTGNHVDRTGNGGAVYIYESPLVLTRCAFRDNSAVYGGAVSSGSSTLITDTCSFHGNTAGHGGAIYASFGTSLLMTSCAFDSNTASGDGGAIFLRESSQSISNSVFVRNSADTGGAMFMAKALHTTLTNCTFWANSGDPYGPGAVFGMSSEEDASLTVANCIFWGSGDELSVSATNAHGFSHNLISSPEDLAELPETNFSADPRFIDALLPEGADGVLGTNDDGLRVLPDSPCIDGGDSEALADSLTVDVRGAPRIQGNSVDIGAYEHTPLPAGSFSVTYCIVNSSQALLSDGNRSGRWMVLPVLPGCDAPAIECTDLPPGHHVIWLGPGRTICVDNPLRVESVDTDQIWTAVVAPAVPGIGGVVHVREGATGSGLSWQDAAGDIQESIEVASLIGGGAVWVAAGTYSPTSWPNGGTSEREKHFSLRNEVTVYGGFPSWDAPGLAEREPVEYVTILSGDIGAAGDTSDNCLHVLYHPEQADLDATSRLDGFTITGGNANTTENGNGGALLNDHSSPSIANCTFSDNTARDCGGAAYVRESQTVFDHCIFRRNDASSGGG